LAVCVLLGSAVATNDAEAARTKQEGRHAGKPAHATQAQKSGHQQAHAARAPRSGRHAISRRGRVAYAASWGGISCVPYARSVTGMAISGNGGDWWYNAAGSYDRGRRPEPGSVMAFRATGGMSRGHVAVVSRVLGPRQVLIDHANWGGPGIRKGTIMHNVSVVDVSDNNDWSAVRVQVGHDAGAYGRVYPTYGFIYNRPDGDTGTAYAAAAPRQAAPRFEQLAEMPIGAAFGAQPVSFQPQDLAPLRKAAAARHR
jgi:surface antigen